MMKLFVYEGYEMVISPEALLLKPFKLLWDRDRSKDKSVARAELGYVYFFADPRSDYAYVLDEDDRRRDIIEGLGLGDWEPDDEVLAAVEFYSRFKPISAGLLEDSFHAVDKLRKFLRDVDLMQMDEKGKPVFSVSHISTALKAVPELVKGLKDAERLVSSDISEAQMTGSKDKTIMEDFYVE